MKREKNWQPESHNTSHQALNMLLHYFVKFLRSSNWMKICKNMLKMCSNLPGSAEIAGMENAARSKMQGWKLHEWKKEENARVENAGVEKGGGKISEKNRQSINSHIL